MDDFLKRRHLIVTTPNPGGNSDYLIRHMAEIVPGTSICLQYVPDKQVLDSSAHAEYLESFKACGDTLETMAAIIVSDMNNQLIPRWVHVEIVRQEGNNTHSVVVEDRQPRWKNDTLMARLRLI